MTEAERAALEHIRQVVDSVIGPVAPPEPAPAESMPSEDVPPEPVIPTTPPSEIVPPEPVAPAATPYETIPPEPVATAASPSETIPPEPVAPDASSSKTIPPEPDSDVAIPGETTPSVPALEMVAPAEPIPAQSAPAVANAACLPVPPLAQYEGENEPELKDPGAAASAIVVQAYTDKSITPKGLYEQAGQNLAKLLSFTQILNAMNVNGVPAELRSNLNLTDLALVLFSGRPVIVPIKQSIFQKAGLADIKFTASYYVVVIGMDLQQVYIRDPFFNSASDQPMAVPWAVFYQAWTQAQGYERAILVPRQQLIRRVQINASSLPVHEEPDDSSSRSGVVTMGELYAVSTQKNGWGKIGEGRWINLSGTLDV